MKVFLLYKDHDFDLQRQLPSNEQALTQDLELNTLFNAMALGDDFLFEVVKKVVLTGSHDDPDSIRYRQNILKECLKNAAIVRNIYDIAVEAVVNKKRQWYGVFGRYPSSILYNSVETLQIFVGMLKKLRDIADEHADKFESDGFTTFFAMLIKELDDDYFASIQNHLKELKFRNGVLISAELGKGNEGANYIIRKPLYKKQSWIQRIFGPKPPVLTFHIAARD